MVRKPLPHILIARLSDFTGGLNLRDDAFSLGPTEVADCLNVRIEPSGGIRQRKTMHYVNSTNLTAGKNIWSFLGNGVTQFVMQDGSDAAWSAGNVTFHAINPDALTTSGIMRAATMSRLTVASSDRLYVQRNAEQVAWKWDGSTATVLADSYGGYNDNIGSPAGGKMPKAKYICTHGGFMFHANTVENSISMPYRLRWSHPGEPEDYRTNDYVDVGADDGDAITGIVSAGHALFIFKNRSVWRLTGFDNQSFVLTRLYATIGAVSQEAIALSPQGVYFFDGTRGAFLLDLNGKLVWLWEKLYCKLADNTIPSAYVPTIVCGWMDNRLWVTLPWGTSTGPTKHFVYDPLCGKNGAWYVYTYAAAQGNTPLVYGPMLEWRPNATTVMLLQIGNGGTAIQQLEFDESSTDTFASSGLLPTSTFNCYFTTSWFSAGAPGFKKAFKRPTFVVGGSKATTIAMQVFKDYETITPKSTTNITVTPTAGSGTAWGTANWGSFDWGTTAAQDQAIVRGSNMGVLYAVQLNVSTPPGSWLSLNAIELHYILRRYGST